MKIHKTIALFTLAAASLVAPVAQATPLSDTDKADMDAACTKDLRDHANAKTCLEPFFKSAVEAGTLIWQDLRDKNLLPSPTPGRVTHGQESYLIACAPRAFEQGQTPDSFLGQAQRCLENPVAIAEANKVSFDKTNAEWLLSRLKALRRYDLTLPPSPQN